MTPNAKYNPNERYYELQITSLRRIKVWHEEEIIRNEQRIKLFGDSLDFSKFKVVNSKGYTKIDGIEEWWLPEHEFRVKPEWIYRWNWRKIVIEKQVPSEFFQEILIILIKEPPQRTKKNEKNKAEIDVRIDIAIEHWTCC